MASSGTESTGIAKRWRELHGEDSWKGLLEPLDMDLRKSLISYGELEGAAGYGFNNEPHSPHYGLCMYGYDDLLTKSGVAAAAAGHYKVTKFLYAAEKNKYTWIGYVAVATDEGVAALGRRDIVVAWRGSVTDTEWGADFQFMPASAKEILGLAEITHLLAAVHSGFLALYTDGNAAAGDSTAAASNNIKGSARDQAHEEVKRLVELHKHEEASITVLGHSLGAALAVLNAVDLVAHGVNAMSLGKPPCPVTAIVFACPHVGNISFKDAFDSFKELKALHVKNKHDPVPQLMPYLPDLGVTLPIDTTLSPYLKEPKKTAHELECYLHGVAGVQGGAAAGGFDLEVHRDVALVNKGADALKDELHVPASWWVAQYKNMVKNDQGKWELKDFEQY